MRSVTPPPLPPGSPGYPRSDRYVVPETRSGSSPVMMWVSISLVVLIGLVGVGFFAAKFLMGSREKIDKPSREFIRLYEEGEYRRAYDELGSAQLKQAVKSEEFENSLRGLKNALGELKNYTPGKFNIRHNMGSDSVGVLEYSAKFEKGDGFIMMTLHQNGTRWKVSGFRIKSPRLDEFMAEWGQDQDGASKMRNDDPDADTVARQFIRLYQRGEYGEAYSAFASTRFKDESAAEDFGAAMSKFSAKMGALKSFTLLNSGADESEDGPILEYRGKFERGEGLIRVEVEEEDGQLLVRKFELSEALEEAAPSAVTAGSEDK